jgi:hypothetical protein
MDFWKLVKISLILICVYLHIPLAQAQNLATSFQPPVATNSNYFTTSTNEGWIVAQDHQDCRPEPDPTGTPCRHLGEDWNYWTGSDYDNVRRPIHAIGNGYVTASGAVNGFAGYIILKHHLPDGSDILSIYGHLQPTGLPQIGDYYTKGQFLADTANQSEMNTWTSFNPHLHFEIRKSQTVTGYADTFLNVGYMSDTGNRYYDPTDVVTINWTTGNPISTDENTDDGYIESFTPVVSCFSIFGAGVNAISTTFEDLTVGFTAKNNCGSLKVLQNVAISFHDNNNPDEFIQTCYKPVPELNESIGAGNTRTFSKKPCTVEQGNLEAGDYRLRFKVKYKVNNADADGTWFHNVAERGIEILPSLNSAPEDDILDFVPAILAGIRPEALCSNEDLSGDWYRIGEYGRTNEDGDSINEDFFAPQYLMTRNTDGTGRGDVLKTTTFFGLLSELYYYIITESKGKGNDLIVKDTYYSGWGYIFDNTREFKVGQNCNSLVENSGIGYEEYKRNMPIIYLDKIWQKSDDGIARTQQGAASYCENLSLGGKSDWYLPNRLDLKKLVVCRDNLNDTNRNRNYLLATGETCANATIYEGNESNASMSPTIYSELLDSKSDRYWTDSRISANNSFFVDFSDGLSAVTSNDNKYYARCVSDR